MRRRTLRLSLLTVLLVLIFSASICYADTMITNGEAFYPSETMIYSVTLSEDTKVAFASDAADAGTVRHYNDPACTDLEGDYYCEGLATVSCKAGDNYFKFKDFGSETVKVYWEDSSAAGDNNSTLETASALEIARGNTFTLNMDSKETHYYTLDLKESGKYTFQTDGNVSIWEGKTEDYDVLIYKNDDSKPHTEILPVGIYTVKIYSVTGNDTATIKRENWVGISKITCDPTITGVIGDTVTYKVNYAPANADSQITIGETKLAARKEGMITKVSQENGVATFKIKLSQLYSKDDEPEWRNWAVKTEEGLEEIITEKAGPGAATIEKKAVGYVYGGQITVSNGEANQFAIQLKVNGKWKTIMKNIKGASGSSWVDIAFYDSTGKKLIKPGKQYTARIVSYADGVKGATKQFKFITAYNTKPTKLKATCVSCKFVKGKGNVWNPYKWAYDYSPDKSIATVKFTFKKAKNSQGTMIGDTIVTKSGKKIKYTFDGKIKKAATYKITVRSVRKKNGMVAYGPPVTLKCKIKKAS